jgi:biotin operon repressor
MGREEIYELLRKNKGKWMSTTDISIALKLSKGSVIKAVRALRKSGEVFFREEYVNGSYRILYCFK